MARRPGLRRRKADKGTVVGPARADKRTKDLSRRMQPGDVAVINHTDIDRVAAEGLITHGAAAVINGGVSISGRYPNGGPIRIVDAGIPLVDDVGPEILDLVQDGDELRIVGGEIWRDGELIATGTVLDLDRIVTAMEDARGNIGVDGGADALRDIGFTPDIIIGDFDSVTDKTLHCGAELIHHVHLDGRAPGRENLVEWGVEYEEFVIDGTSEDVAMLLAYEAGATLIVAVGTHATMVEFLDKGRKGMSSTFLTRLRLGPMLVDAKGVSRLYEGRVRRRDLVALVAAALLAMIVISVVAEPIHVFFDGIRVTLKDLWYSVTGS
jgi:uncharacterized membrane-anchored protein